MMALSFAVWAAAVEREAGVAWKGFEPVGFGFDFADN
jgi:hypothetical protein